MSDVLNNSEKKSFEVHVIILKEEWSENVLVEFKIF